MTLTRINTNSITDGSIIDADINASAAIAGTKVSPDFGSQNIVTTGGLTVDTNTLVVDATNNRVGIGTSSPSSLLHLSSNLPVLTFTDVNDASSSIVYQDDNLFVIDVDSANAKASSALAFKVDNTERARIDSSGRVGIGTTPSTKLHVAGSGQQVVKIQDTGNTNGFDLGNNTTESFVSTADNKPITFYTNNQERAKIDASGRLLVGTSSTSTNSKVVIEGSSTSATGPAIVYLQRGQAAASISSGDTLGIIDFTDNAGNLYAQIYSQTDAAGGSSDYPGRLVFSTTEDGASSPTERMRIGKTGALWTLSTGSVSQFSTTQGAGTTYYLYAGIYGASDTAGANGTTSFRVWSNGNVQNTNNSYTAISDLKLKENIVDAGSQWSDIKALQVRNYNLKEGQTHRQIGLIAQEVEPISPGLVYESPDLDEEGNDLGTVTKSVNYSVLYMKAVKALQEAMERIEQLEAKVAALESA